MVAQYIAVTAILGMAVVYAILRIVRTWRDAQSRCYGCEGCAIKEQMMRAQHDKHTRKKKRKGEIACPHKK